MRNHLVKIMGIILCGAFLCGALTGCEGLDANFEYQVHDEAMQLASDRYYIVEKHGIPSIIFNDELVPINVNGEVCEVGGYKIAVQEYVRKSRESNYFKLVIQAINPEGDLIIPGATNCTSYINDEPKSYVFYYGRLRILTNGNIINEANPDEAITAPQEG